MKLAGILLLAAAGILFAWGWLASDSLPSAFTRLFRSGPRDRTLWLFGGSAASALLGLRLLFPAAPRKA